MWFKIQNELINLSSISNFTFDDNALQLKITYIGGEKKTFKYSTWPDFNSTKNSIDEMLDKHMLEADENRKALEKEQKIQEMFDTLQCIYSIGEDGVINDILNGRA